MVVSGGRRLVRRLAKPCFFGLVVFLLFFFAEYTVSYSHFPEGVAALPTEVRDKITIETISGMMQMHFNQAMGEDTSNVQESVTVETWNMTGDQVYMSPLMTTALGCENLYMSQLSVRIDTDNVLSSETVGAANVSVFDSEGNSLLANKVVMMDFIPRQTTSATANFSILTIDSNPVFLVRVTFPSGDDILQATNGSARVSLIEYILLELGVLTR